MKVNVEYCDPFDGLEEGFWMKVEHCGRYMWAAQWLKKNNYTFVADIACANGYGSKILSHMIKKVIAIDRNKDYLNKAESNRSIKYVCCDLDQETLPVEIKNVDAIVCFETLEHLQKPKNVIQAFSDCLASGGQLLLSVPNDRYEILNEDGGNRDPFHIHVFSKDTVKKMLEDAGFKIEELLGQDICNRVVTRISEMGKSGQYKKQELEKIWKFDKKTIQLYAEIFGKPEASNVEESYSHIYVCRKK